MDGDTDADADVDVKCRFANCRCGSGFGGGMVEVGACGDSAVDKELMVCKGGDAGRYMASGV